MLRQVTVPVAELTGMKPTHVSVLIGLLSFADRAGKCWPQQRRLAAIVGMSLTAVQRALVEMKEAGHLTIRRRFGTSSVYRVAKRFLPQFRIRNIEPQAPPAAPADPPVVRCSEFGTEGIAKKEGQTDLEKEEERSSARRSAPPPVAARTGPNPHARKAWLRTLHTFIGERSTGAAQWAGFELISAAQTGTLTRMQQRDLDWLDKQMRACGYKPAR